MYEAIIQGAHIGRLQGIWRANSETGRRFRVLFSWQNFAALQPKEVMDYDSRVVSILCLAHRTTSLRITSEQRNGDTGLR